MSHQIQREVEGRDSCHRPNGDPFDRGMALFPAGSPVESQDFVVTLAALIRSSFEGGHCALYFATGLQDGFAGFERNCLSKDFPLRTECRCHRTQNACPSMGW
jgi:hypothetical protein